MDEPIMMLTTCPTQDEARKIAKTLLEKKHIGCANLMPMASMYWWGGKITDEDEILLLIKTVKSKYDEVAQIIKGLHSYDTPLIESIVIEKMDSKYLDWLKGCLEK